MSRRIGGMNHSIAIFPVDLLFSSVYCSKLSLTLYEVENKKYKSVFISAQLSMLYIRLSPGNRGVVRCVIEGMIKILKSDILQKSDILLYIYIQRCSKDSDSSRNVKTLILWGWGGQVL